MSVQLVVTRGFGNGTLTGDIPSVVTAGYTQGEPPPIWTKQADVLTVWTPQTGS